MSQSLRFTGNKCDPVLLHKRDFGSERFYQFGGWLVGWLVVGLLVGWLVVCWVVGWLLGCWLVVGWLLGRWLVATESLKVGAG